MSCCLFQGLVVYYLEGGRGRFAGGGGSELLRGVIFEMLIDFWESNKRACSFNKLHESSKKHPGRRPHI